MASKKYLDDNGLLYFWGKIKSALTNKQDTLVSGTNIKTINNTSLLGSGDISIGSSTLQSSLLLDWVSTSDNQNTLLDDLTKYTFIAFMFGETASDTSSNAFISFAPVDLFLNYFYNDGTSHKSYNLYFDYPNGKNLRAVYHTTNNKMRIWGNSMSGYVKIIGYK